MQFVKIFFYIINNDFIDINDLDDILRNNIIHQGLSVWTMIRWLKESNWTIHSEVRNSWKINKTEEYLYRFAVYHFSTSREWHEKIQNIILITGKSYTGKKRIQTPRMEHIDRYLLIWLTEMDPNVWKTSIHQLKKEIPKPYWNWFFCHYMATSITKKLQNLYWYELQLCKAN